jgi:phosphoglycerate dehydrogenase-like enzyme
MTAPTEPFVILVSSDFYDPFADKLAALGEPRFVWKRLSYPKRPDDFLDLLTDADVAISRQDLSEEQYAIAPRLKLLQLPTAGYDHIDLKRAARHGVFVGINGGANAISVAEHTMMLILCLNRQLLFHHNAVVNGPWVNRKHECLELFGKTLGIVGLGHVGKQVAMRARAFGMEVIFNDIRRDAPDFEKQYELTFAPFEQLLAVSDVVSFHVPLTDKTRNMINARTLGLMRPDGLLINTSRGGTQDEDALSTALASGRLRGAGLDVFNTEPLPRDSALLTLGNVVLTPHSGPSLETLGRVVSNMAVNINNVSRGMPPQFVAVDLDHGE